MARNISKRGRPSDYSKELIEEICNNIASSSKGIKLLCKENGHWPNKDTIFTWLKNNKEFSDQYAQAKRCQIEFLVDEVLEIADDASQDQLIDNEGKTIFNPQSVSRARLKIDTRKWLACKLVPRVYSNNPNDEHDSNSKLLQEARELRDRLDVKNRKDY